MKQCNIKGTCCALLLSLMLTGCDSGGTRSVTATPAASGNGKFYINFMTATVKFTNIEAYEGISGKKKTFNCTGVYLDTGSNTNKSGKKYGFFKFTTNGEYQEIYSKECVKDRPSTVHVYLNSSGSSTKAYNLKYC